MMDFSSWLARTPKGKAPKKPLPRVTPKRAKQNREYSVKRKAYLLRNPYCEAIGKIADHLYDRVTAREYRTVPSLLQLATEIHHTKKPKCKYLNDESTWLAVCHWSHRWIEEHKDIARQLGLLF